MVNKTISKHTWFHFYDNISGIFPTKKIIYVIDFYSLKNFFCIDMNNINYADLRINARNTNTELPFIDFNKNIRVSLDPMDRWASVPNSTCETSQKDSYLNLKDYKHIKVDIEFTLLNPTFEKLLFS